MTYPVSDGKENSLLAGMLSSLGRAQEEDFLSG
jgi:hypothetical protein